MRSLRAWASSERGSAVLAFALALAWVALVRPGPLDLPYWWDEADVYVPGSKWVAENDLRVTPGVFPDDYSRGHPVLLYWLAGAAFRAAGPGPTTGHLVVLPFTVLALFFTYLLGAWMHDRRIGFGAMALIAATPLFMSMGNMLLPEMPLTALAVASLAFYARRRLGAAILCGVLAVWIKETGVFAAAALTGALLYEGWRTRRWRWGAIAASTVPVLALIAFFVWQKVHAGYFVFPHHANLFADRPLELSNLWTVWPSLLGWHGRWIAVGGALVALGLGARARPMRESPPDRMRRESTGVAIGLLVLANFVFFTKMFWLERYALPAHPGLLVLVAALLLGAGTRSRIRTRLGVAAIVASVTVGVASLWAPTDPDEEEHTYAYADAIATHRAAFAELPDAGAILTPWPMQIELRYPYLGYVDAPRETLHPRSTDDDADFVAILYAERSWRARELRQLAERRGFDHEQRFQRGVAQALILRTRRE